MVKLSIEKIKIGKIPEGTLEVQPFINKNNKQISLAILKKNTSPFILNKILNDLSLNKKIRLRIEEVPIKFKNKEAKK